MILDAARILLGYLLGSISGSLLLGRLRGVDIRQQGSGNAGGTNALRTQGPWFALGVVVIDVGKSALAAWLGGLGIADERHALIVALLAAAGAAAGHVWPLYFGFRGGKGVAAVLGALLVLWPVGVLTMLGVALLVLTTTGYVGLSSILASAALMPAAVLYAPEPHRLVWIVAAVGVAGFVLFTHRSNVQRLRAGTEHRFEKVRVLGRFFAKKP
jgi:glycerol-3-phosphate acyltransferase PlsY